MLITKGVNIITLKFFLIAFEYINPDGNILLFFKWSLSTYLLTIDGSFEYS